MKTKNEGFTNYVAPAFFIVSWIVFSLFLKFLNSDNIVFSFFKYISQYITFTLAIILISKDIGALFRNKSVKKFGDKIRGLLKKLSGQKVFRIIYKLKRSAKSISAGARGRAVGEKESAEAGIQAAKMEDQAAEMENQTESRGQSDPELYKIDRDHMKGENDQQAGDGSRVRGKLKIVLYILFVGAHALNAWLFLGKIFSDTYYNSDLFGGYLVISAFVILSIMAFTIKKFLGSREGYAYNTVVDYCGFFGVLLLIGSIFLVIKTMFALEYTIWLVWILKIASVYLVVSLGLSILMSFFKKEEKKFDYQIHIPFINGKGFSIKNFMEVFEKNTNISIKSLWSLEYLLTTFPAFLLSIVLILSLATCLYKVESYQEGAVYRFGKLNENSIKTEGLHIKLPWPIEKVEIYNTKREKSLQIGYKTTTTGDFLWTVPHEGGEYTLVLGNGNELVAINAKVNYSIKDLYLYLTNYQNPEVLLSDVSYELLTNKTITKTLNDFLMEDRTRLSEELKKDLTLYSEASGLGLEVKNVVIQSIHPAVEVADIYQGVVGAGIEKQSRIIKAQTQASKLIAEAEQDREGTIMAAIQSQTEKLANAEYEMSVYEAAFEAYSQNKESFKLDKYLQTYEKVIEGNKLYIFSPRTSKNMQNYVINRGGKNSEQAIIIN